MHEGTDKLIADTGKCYEKIRLIEFSKSLKKVAILSSWID